MSDLARRLRKESTNAERALWRELRGRRLCGHKFRRQHPVGPYVVDFVCIERNLIVEVDGGHHCSQQDADLKRTETLNALGFSVIRFWNDEVLNQRTSVLEAILEELEEPHPHPSPSPSRERD